MDVDEEEEEGDSTQHLRKVLDYGIEVDFGILSANEREVRKLDGACFHLILTVPLLMGRFRRRTPLAKYLVNLTPQ
jgi:hypothetical protein